MRPITTVRWCAMTSNGDWRRYVEAGAAVGQVAAARVEDITQRLLSSEDQDRQSAWQEIELLARFGLQMGEQLLDLARKELDEGLGDLATDPLKHLLAYLSEAMRGQPQGPQGTDSSTDSTFLDTETQPSNNETLDLHLVVELPTKSTGKQGRKLPSSTSGAIKKHAKKDKAIKGNKGKAKDKRAKKAARAQDLVPDANQSSERASKNRKNRKKSRK